MQTADTKNIYQTEKSKTALKKKVKNLGAKYIFNKNV